MENGSSNVTALLRQWRDGDGAAEERLFELILPELRRIARRCMSRERRDHTLQPTELVGQIYERLVNAKDRDWQNRSHFFASAARTMRWYLIDYARKRQSTPEVTLEEAQSVLPAGTDVETALLVNNLMDQLELQNAQWCALVEMKYYLGLKDQEAAETLGMSVRSLQRQWHDARSWLFDRLKENPAEPQR